MKFKIDIVYNDKGANAAMDKSKTKSKEVTTALKKDVTERRNLFRTYERDRKKGAAAYNKIAEKQRMQDIIAGRSLKAFITQKYAEAKARINNIAAIRTETAMIQGQAALASIGHRGLGKTQGIGRGPGSGKLWEEMDQAVVDDEMLYQKRMARIRKLKKIPSESAEWDPVAGDHRGMAKGQAKSLRDTGRAATETGKRVSFMNSKFARFSIIMSGIAASLFVFQNIVRAIKTMIEVIIKWESATQKAQATLHLTGIEIQNITDYARGIGQSGVMGGDEVINRLTQLRMQGYKAAEAMKMLQDEIAWKESTMGEMETSLANLKGSLSELLIILGEKNKKRMVTFFDSIADSIDGIIARQRMSEWEKFIAHLKRVGEFAERYHKYFSVAGWMGISPSGLIDKINIGP